MNWNRTDQHSLFVKYSAMNANVACPFSLGQAGGDALGAAVLPERTHAGADRDDRAHADALAALCGRRNDRLDAHDAAGQELRITERISGWTFWGFREPMVRTRGKAACLDSL